MLTQILSSKKLQPLAFLPRWLVGSLKETLVLLDTLDLAFLCRRARVPSIAALGLQVTSPHSSPMILKGLFCYQFLIKLFLREGDLGRRGLNFWEGKPSTERALFPGQTRSPQNNINHLYPWQGGFKKNQSGKVSLILVFSNRMGLWFLSLGSLSTLPCFSLSSWLRKTLSLSSMYTQVAWMAQMG